MAAQRIGILHPGQMGIVVASSARNSGHDVFWVSEGRSAASAERARAVSLQDAGTLAKFCELCSVIVSICPPQFAEDLAGQVAALAFQGTYVDANAIAPERVQRMAARMEKQGAHFVDAGIIGPPTAVRNRTWLYLSGDHASNVAPYFSAGPVEIEVLAGGVGRASALKMCFAAYSKGSIALSCAVLGAACELDVVDELKRQWFRSDFSLHDIEHEICRAAPKAWRFAAEMEEIAATFKTAGFPDGFHQAAADIFDRLQAFKNSKNPAVSNILNSLVATTIDTKLR